jgi:two-component system, chemotaxis family, response regulator Rcp1
MPPIEILLIEDNPDDVDLTVEAFRAVTRPTRLNVVENGADAVAYLRKETVFRTARRPDLILLDLNLPGRSGHEVLGDIKGNPAFRVIPLIVLTSSAAPSDIERSYELAANCYITKPLSLEGFEQVARRIERFWLDAVALPPHEESDPS